MPELGTSGSARGVCSNAHPYRDKHARCDATPHLDSFTRLKGVDEQPYFPYYYV